MTKEHTPTTAARGGIRTFAIVWFGQLVSIVGTSLTWFGLSIWVYLETGSVTQLSMMLLAATLPRILLSPIAGALVDRWDRRWAMILSDAASGLGTVVVAIAFITDSVSIPLLVVVAAVSSMFEAFHWPAYQAATTLLVPKERYSQASGLVQMAEAAGQLLAPLLGAIMVTAGGIALLIIIDAVTFAIALVTLAIVRFPSPERSEVGDDAAGTVISEALFGFRYIYDRRPLLAMLVLFAGLNLVFGFITPVFIAYMLSFTSETTMGTMMTIGTTGMIAGSIVASTWRVTSGRIAKLLLAIAILGVMLVGIGASTWVVAVTATLWIGMLAVPIGSAMSQSIWMAKVEPDVQGRVFSVRMMIAQITSPIALLLAGPLTDGVFVPMMAGDGPVAGLLAGLVGRGDHAGYAAFFVAIGLGTILLAVAGWSYPGLRNLESLLPDAVGLPSEQSAEVEVELLA